MHVEDGVIRIRRLSHEYANALMVAAFALGQAESQAGIEAAYSTLQGTREALYKEIAALERRAGITNQPIQIRF